MQEEMRILAREQQKLFSFRHVHPEMCDRLAAKDKDALLTFRNLFEHCLENGKSCMLSQEVLSQKRKALASLTELASGYFDRVEVFFLIRDPAESIQSAYLQWGFRDGRISRRINKLIKNLGDTESAIMISCKEWFSLLQLRDAINNQFISFMIFLNPAELLREFSETLHDGGSRLSALSFDDSPGDQSLLASCIERLEVQDSFGTHIPQKPVVANRSFNPFAVEIIAREKDRSMFREQALISPHQNALVREYSSLLDEQVGSTLGFDDDGLAATLTGMVSAAIRPLRMDINDNIAQGDWSRFHRRSSISGFPPWDHILEVYTDALESRIRHFGSMHKLQLQKAAELYEKLSRK